MEAFGQAEGAVRERPGRLVSVGRPFALVCLGPDTQNTGKIIDVRR